MTLKQAIDQVDALKPNAYTTDQKTKWLSTLEGSIKKVADKWGDKTYTNFVAYNYTDDQNVQLIAQSPYDELYLLYLAAQIDFWSKEYVSYSNSQLMFNSLLGEYEKELRDINTEEPVHITGLWG